MLTSNGEYFNPPYIEKWYTDLDKLCKSLNVPNPATSRKEEPTMTDNSFYYSDLIGIPVTSAYSKAARNKELKELSDALYLALISPPPQFPNTSSNEKFLEPVTVFHNEVSEYDNEPLGGTVKCKQFYVSLGIFDLDTTSAVATITKDNKLELTWTERAGKGKFSSKIPSYLVATSAPILRYEGGVLDIRVPVESRSKNEAVFVGKLESK